jgi:hypothetical protein
VIVARRSDKQKIAEHFHVHDPWILILGRAGLRYRTLEANTWADRKDTGWRSKNGLGQDEAPDLVADCRTRGCALAGASQTMPRLSGAPVLHRLDGSVHGIAVMGSPARVTGATVKDSNDKPPYRLWHTVSAACGRSHWLVLARCPVTSIQKAQSRDQVPALRRHAAVPGQGLIPRSALCGGIIWDRLEKHIGATLNGNQYS